MVALAGTDWAPRSPRFDIVPGISGCARGAFEAVASSPLGGARGPWGGHPLAPCASSTQTSLQVSHPQAAWAPHPAPVWSPRNPSWRGVAPRPRRLRRWVPGFPEWRAFGHGRALAGSSVGAVGSGVGSWRIHRFSAIGCKLWLSWRRPRISAARGWRSPGCAAAPPEPGRGCHGSQ